MVGPVRIHVRIDDIVSDTLSALTVGFNRVLVLKYVLIRY